MVQCKLKHMRRLRATAIAWITAPLGAVAYLYFVALWTHDRGSQSAHAFLTDASLIYLTAATATTLIGLPIHAILVASSCRSVAAYIAAGVISTLLIFMPEWYRVEAWSIDTARMTLYFCGIALTVASLFSLVYLRLSQSSSQN